MKSQKYKFHPHFSRNRIQPSTKWLRLIDVVKHIVLPVPFILILHFEKLIQQPPLLSNTFTQAFSGIKPITETIFLIEFAYRIPSPAMPTGKEKFYRFYQLIILR